MSQKEIEPIPWAEVWERVHNGENKGTVDTPSGYPLWYNVGVFNYGTKRFHQIGVEDFRDSAFQMKAFVDLSDDSLTLNLRTRGFGGVESDRHPAMHASQFVTQALGFFENQYIAPTRFIGKWNSNDGWRDNYDIFTKKYRKTRDKYFAANHTWSGGVIMNNGFDGASEVQLKGRTPGGNPKEITAIFPRKK